MRMTNLPKEAVEVLKRSYKGATNPREKERYHALWLKATGYKRAEICSLLATGERSLGRWIQSYLRDGLSALKDKPQQGNNRKLTTKQKNQIKNLIHKKKPEDLGFEGNFWDVSLLQRLIQEKFGINYSPISCQRLFKYSGFSFHKPDKVNKKQNKSAIKDWEKKIKKDWRGTARKMGWYW